jgi:ATP/maltotriose-dependent transcriptional regulator MalT
MTGSEKELILLRKSNRPAKLIPPEPGHYFIRQSLMKKLSCLLESPAKVWLSSPGGAGKTALVRSLLANDERPLYWYQVDSEERDPANLFYYLAMVVDGEKSEKASLPQLQPEYLPNLEVFCRNFCRSLFSSIGSPFIMVFDDLQEGPGETLFGPFLSAFMAELPVNSCLLVLSREEPYVCFARDRINHNLAHLSWDDLRLSADETHGFLGWVNKQEPSQKVSDQAYHLTQGWMAGLLLYTDSAFDIEEQQPRYFERTDLLFDYFAGEVFTHTPAANREFLLLCSLLPSIEVSIVKSLTGRSDASDILERLVRENNFTYRIASSHEAYRFHPLFRHFLQSKANQVFASQEAALWLERAARLLIESSQYESAASLLIEAEAWTQLIEIISSQADGLIRQGRWQTLLQWLDALPAEIRKSSPWLCYWRGMCLMATDPPMALSELTQAFNLFDGESNAVGSMLSWGMAVNAIVIGWNDCVVLDKWIERFDSLRAQYVDYPSLEIESLMVQGICKSLAWRYPERADLSAWADRLYQLVTSSNDSDFRLLAGSNLVLYHLVSGSIAKAESLVDVLNSDLHSTVVSPLKKLIWLGTRGVLEWVLVDRAGSIATIEEGRSIIEASGVHVMDVRLYAQGITLGLTTGDLTLARKLFAELPSNPIITSLDHAYYAFLQAYLSLLEEDMEKAVVLAETAVKRASEGGNMVIKAMSLSILTMVLYQDRQLKRAEEVLQEGLEVTRGMNLLRSSLLIQAAYMALENEDLEKTRSCLREGFALAAREGYRNFLPWRDEVMTLLCREALIADIEVDYVTRLADIRNLQLEQLIPAKLSPKEMETLGWVQEGKKTWEIAKIMGVSEGTVKFHVGNILRKLGARSRTQAVAIALKAGLLKEEELGY